VPRGQRDGSLWPYSRFSRQEPLLFYQVAPQLYSRGYELLNFVKCKNVYCLFARDEIPAYPEYVLIQWLSVNEQLAVGNWKYIL
jgi:hypothetical protein